jgi:hypothetical protein
LASSRNWIGYLFQFIDDFGQMPLDLRQLIRLQEITRRLAASLEAAMTGTVREGSIT